MSMYEIYQSGFEYHIQKQTFYHNCGVFVGTRQECEDRLKLLLQSPIKLGDVIEEGLVRRLDIVYNSDTVTLFKAIGVRKDSPIMGNETLKSFLYEKI